MTTDLTPEVLAELRQLDGLAAPGPWAHDGFCRIDSAPLSGGRQMSIYAEGGHDENDADLIALMRNHLPALLDAAEREAAARKRVEELEASLRLIAEHDTVMARLEPDAHDALVKALSTSTEQEKG